MFSVEGMSKKVSDYICSNLDLDNRNREIIAYGAFTVIQTCFAYIIAIIIGLIFNVLIQALIISFCGSILKKYSGGAHASSAGRCIVVGNLIILLLSFLSILIIRTFQINSLLLLLIFCFSSSLLLVYKLAPVDSKSKPINNINKKKRLKKLSLVTLTLFLIIALIFVFLFYLHNSYTYGIVSISIMLGCFWQSITLTKFGHVFVTYLDTFLKYIL